jgi:hypothetical protein
LTADPADQLAVQQALDLTVIQLSKHAAEGSKGSAIRGSARRHPRAAPDRAIPAGKPVTTQRGRGARWHERCCRLAA